MSSEAKNNKFLWIGIGAAVLAAAFYFSGVIPPKEDVTGTIGAAKKYQSEQITAEDVKLDENAVQEWMQSDEFDRLVNDPETKKIIKSKEFQQGLANDALISSLRRVGLRSALQDAAFSQNLSRAFQDEGFSQSLSRAFQDEGFSQSLSRALQCEAFSQSLSRAFQDQALSQNLSRAFQDEGFSQSLSRAFQDEGFSQSLSRAFQDEAFSQNLSRALQSEAFSQSLMESGLRSSLLDSLSDAE